MPEDPKLTITAEVITPESVGLEFIQPRREDRPWPKPMRDQARLGIVGEFVEAVDPTTEGDPNAILMQFLAGIGSLLGGKLQLDFGEARHGLRIWVLVVGETARGKKGTGAERVLALLDGVDPTWKRRRRVGISSGEAIVHHVRDDVKQVRRKVSADGTVCDLPDTKVGVADKRLFLKEAEFSRVLHNARRSGATLSAMMREAWDSDLLMTTAKQNPECATGAHVTIVGHITPRELAGLFSKTEISNGFANRFLYACSRSSKELMRPRGLAASVRDQLTARLREVCEFAKARANEGRSIELSEAAWEHWPGIRRQIESEIVESDDAGLVLATVITRGLPYALRLAALYAVLERSLTVEPRHLDAAHEVWRYSVASARVIFGDEVTDPVARKVWNALLAAPDGRLRRGKMVDLLGRHQSAREITRARDVLIFAGKIRAYRDRRRPGRPVEWWVRRGRWGTSSRERTS